MDIAYLDRFEWNAEKADTNFTKHGIDFLDVVDIFDMPRIEREQKDRGESRIFCLGIVKGCILAVVYTIRQNRTRLISARLANSRERETYDQIFGPLYHPTRHRQD